MSATTVLAQGPRNGSFTTSSVAAPAGSSLVSVVCPMSDADAQNGSISCRIVTEFSTDGGSSWSAFSDPYNWQGGIGPRGNFTKPEESLAAPSTDAHQIRVVLDTLGNTIDTGVTLEVT